MDSLLRFVEQLLKRDLRQLLLHGLVYHGKIAVQHDMDVPTDRAGGIGVLMEMERALGFLDCLEYIQQGNILCILGKMCAADARVHLNDSGGLQLAERAPYDHGINADAARDEVGSGFVLPVEHGNTQQNMNGDGEPRGKLHGSHHLLHTS